MAASKRSRCAILRTSAIGNNSDRAQGQCHIGASVTALPFKNAAPFNTANSPLVPAGGKAQLTAGIPIGVSQGFATQGSSALQIGNPASWTTGTEVRIPLSVPESSTLRNIREACEICAFAPLRQSKGDRGNLRVGIFAPFGEILSVSNFGGGLWRPCG